MTRSSSGSSSCALKIGLDVYDLQSEMNALRMLATLRTERPHATFPQLFQADDWDFLGAAFPFYTMTFIPGVPIAQFAKVYGIGALLRSGSLLLKALRDLHELGWAFGDLKSDNVLVGAGGKPALIDFGGATPFGRAVKQYSELYDRGLWRSGGRTSEPSYDLFSFCVLMLEGAGELNRLKALFEQADRRNAGALQALVDGCSALRPVSDCLKRMIRGEYGRLDEALKDWENACGDRALKIRRKAGVADWSAYWLTGSAAAFAVSLWWVLLK